MTLPTPSNRNLSLNYLVLPPSARHHYVNRVAAGTHKNLVSVSSSVRQLQVNNFKVSSTSIFRESCIVMLDCPFYQQHDICFFFFTGLRSPILRPQEEKSVSLREKSNSIEFGVFRRTSNRIKVRMKSVRGKKLYGRRIRSLNFLLLMFLLLV